MWPGCGWAVGAMIDKAHLQIVSKTDIFISGRSCCSASSDEWRPWLLCCGSRSWWEESACHVWACRFDLYIHVSKICHIYILYQVISFSCTSGASLLDPICRTQFSARHCWRCWSDVREPRKILLVKWDSSLYNEGLGKVVEQWNLEEHLAATFAVGEASQSVSKLKRWSLCCLKILSTCPQGPQFPLVPTSSMGWRQVALGTVWGDQTESVTH